MGLTVGVCLLRARVVGSMDQNDSPQDFLAPESPRYGRAVVALAPDPKVKEKSRSVFSSWELAWEYGFTDLDGSRAALGQLCQEEGRRAKNLRCAILFLLVAPALYG